MWINQALGKLSDNKTYSRDDLFRLFTLEKKDLSNSAFRWTLYNLLQKEKLFRTDYDTYVTVKPKVLPEYKPYYSQRAVTLLEMLEEKYPDLEFVVFESVLLNEFLNHQIAQNTIYVQVEKDVSSYIFDMLLENHTGSVLYRPGKSEFDRYWTKECIVVLDLVSQSPLSRDKKHEITIEKMIVDILAEKSIAATFSPSELPFVYENVMKSYLVDIRKVNRYAGRRGKTSEVEKLVGGLD